MSIRSILEADRILITQKYESGISTNKLAKEYNCNAGTIWLALKDWEVKIKKLQIFEGNIEDYKEQIVEYYNQGMSCTKISKLLSISEPTILRNLKKWGYDTSRYDSNKKNLIKMKDRKQEIIEKFKEGRSALSIANEFGYGGPSISEALKKWGYDPKDNYYDCDLTIFDDLDREDVLWMLGFIWTDGNNSGKGFRIELTDLDAIEKIKKICKYEGPIYIKKLSTLSRKTQYGISITRKILSDKLTSLGCMPSKTYIIKPLDLKLLKDPMLIKHWWRSAIEGDGCLSKSKGRIRALSFTGTLEMCQGFQQYCKDTLGSQITLYHKKGTHHNIWAAVSNKIQDSFKIADHLYGGATYYLNRKYARYLEFKKQIAASHSI